MDKRRSHEPSRRLKRDLESTRLFHSKLWITCGSVNSNGRHVRLSTVCVSTIGGAASVIRLQSHNLQAKNHCCDAPCAYITGLGLADPRRVSHYPVDLLDSRSMTTERHKTKKAATNDAAIAVQTMHIPIRADLWSLVMICVCLQARSSP